MDWDSVQEFIEEYQPVIDWLQYNWVTIVLTGEIVGAVLAVKCGHYRRGIGWLSAALITIWMGALE